MDKNQARVSRDPQKIISVITGIFLGLLTLCGFTLNYDALRDLAVLYGIPDHLSFLWPILIDGGIVTISLSALRNQFRNESIVYPASIVVLLTGLTVFFAVMHSKPQEDHPAYLGAVISATSPLVLCLSFETMLRQIRSSSQSDNRQASKKSTSRKSGSSRRRHSKKNSSRSRQILNLITTQDGITHAEIANKLRCSTKTVQRTIRELETKGFIESHHGDPKSGSQ